MDTLELAPASHDTETYPGESFESLSVADLEWLNKLGATPLDDDQLDSINQLINAGSKNLRSDTDPETIQSVMRARQEFFGQILGWDDDTHPLRSAYQSFQNDNPTIIPLRTFIDTQRTMHQLGLDAPKVITTHTAALSYNQESVRDKMANLTEPELNAAKVVTTLPAALGLKKESIRDKMANLTQLGLKAANVVNALPVALSYNQEKIRLTCYVLMKAGLWEASGEFEGYRALLNRGEKLNIFTVPLETLLIHFADEALHPRINNHSMRRHLTDRGIATATERKAATKELLGNTDARDKLGYLAALYALKEKIEIAY